MFLLMPSLMAQDRIDDLLRNADEDRLAALARMPAVPAVRLRERIRRTARRVRLVTRGAAA
jgi:hypothetical protein